MKTCPACHRPVADDAHVCPHPDCAKPLPVAANRPAPQRPPPPPRKVTLQAADLHGAAATSAARNPDDRRSGRQWLTLLALLVLAAVFCGGIYYAAVSQRGSSNAEVVRAPSETKSKDTPSVNASAKSAGGEPMPPPASPAAESASKEKAGPSKQPAENPAEAREKDSEKLANPEQTAAAKARPPEVLGLYSQRTAPNRDDWIGELGGTTASEQAVAAGLDWLARHQAPDGHWGPDCLGGNPNSQCVKGQECSGQGDRYEAALTGLAILAFQAGGHYDFNEHLYSERVARGLDFLIENQGPNGELVGSLSQARNLPAPAMARYERCYMYEHGIATFALCEACAVAKASRRTPSPKTLEAAVRAVKFIESQQHDDGGWRYTPLRGEPSDTSVSGWSMLALKTAREAEIALDEQTMPRLVAFFDRELEPLTGRTHYLLSLFSTDALTGVGMLVDEFVLLKRDTRRIALAAPYLAEQAEDRWGPHKNVQADHYLWYNCTLAMFQAGGEPWRRWNAVVRDRVIELQEKGTECRRGSWPPNDRWGGTGGRIYTTALAVLTLEVYYRFAQERLIADRPGQ